MKYEKIHTLFKRDTKQRNHVIIPGEFSKDEFNNVILWSVSEKIDGMNMRVIFSKECVCDEKECKTVEFRGRTDKAMIPPILLKFMNDTFKVDKLSEVFDLELAETVILYGEGFGPKIQKGGRYRDDVSFILFDVNIDGIWIKESDVTRFASELGIERVPLLGHMVHEDVIEYIKLHPLSHVGTFGKHPDMEGVVCRSEPLMLDRMGRRVIWKLKVEDFDKLEAVSKNVNRGENRGTFTE